MFDVKKLQNNIKEYNQKTVEAQIARVEAWIEKAYIECEKASLQGEKTCRVEPMDSIKDTKLAIATLIQKYHCNPKYTLELSSGRVQIGWYE